MASPEADRPTVAEPDGDGGARAVRRLSAILFSDMVGYTALMQEDESLARRNRTRQRQALERHIGAEGGRILQWYGDGALSVFDSAVGAVAAAVATQQELNEEPKVALRSGIHTGDVVYDEEGVFGDGVNVASRVQSLGSPGSVLISEKVQDEIKNQPRFRTVSLGEFNLKNVRRPVAVYALVADGLSLPGPESLPSPAHEALRSVAVLPFANMSADPENEFFSDGITEELINVLTRVNGLQVTARTSSFAFKGKHVDIREIATTLGVDTVLEGSVRRSGQRARITAQLIDASNGYHIFSETYDRTLEDVFETQDEIARMIVRAVEDRLTPDRRQAPLVTPRTNAEAHAWYLRGLHEYARWTPEGNRRSVEMFRKAIEIDPGYAAAHANLAVVHHQIARWGQADVPTHWAAAEMAAKRALELDPSLGEAHMVLALERLLRAWDFDEAYTRFQKALGLSPGSAVVRMEYATWLTVMGEFDRAIDEVDAAGQLDPLSLPVMLMRADTRMNAGLAEEAIEILDRILEQDPTFRAAVQRKGICLAVAGRLEEAAAELDRVVAITGDESRWLGERGFVYTLLGREADARRNLELLQERVRTEPENPRDIDFYILYVGLREFDEARKALERAIERRLAGVLFMVNSAFWMVAREDPGFDQVFRKHGLDKLKRTDRFESAPRR
jgi:adenylate cyclase